MSKQTITAITDAVMGKMAEWQSWPLDRIKNRITDPQLVIWDFQRNCGQSLMYCLPG